jgi:hypothetical protein
MKFKLLLFLIVNLTISKVIGQTNEVSLVVSSKGTTEEDAKTNALRSAIEQAFGTFVSSRTEILYDDLVQDQIVSLSNGNIKKFEIVSSLFLPDQSLHLVTLNATVSLDKLTTFVQSMGYNDVAFDGGGFAMNLKIQKLNASSEVLAIKNLLEQGLNLSKEFFDRELVVGNPTLEPSNRVSNPKYQVPLTINSNLSTNWRSYYQFYVKTLHGISMSREEVDTYKSLNKKVYQLVLLNAQYREIDLSTLTLGQQEAYKKSGLRPPLTPAGFKIVDTLSFRTPQSLSNLTSFYILLNAKYLDGVTIAHDLDTLDVQIDFDAQYQIGTNRDKKWIDYTPSNLWFFQDMPFEAYSDVETIVKSVQAFEPIIKKGKQIGSLPVGMRPTKVVQRPLIELDYYLFPIFSFTVNGYRIEPYSAKDEFWAPLASSINSSEYFSALGSISEQIFSRRMPGGFDYFNWSGGDFRTRIFEIANPISHQYQIQIIASFTEQELERLKGFKLVK